MTLPDGNETKDQAAGDQAAEIQAAGVERAVAMHVEQADRTEAAAVDRSETSAMTGRRAAAGRALVEAEAPVAVNPFLAKAANDPEPAPPRSFRSVVLDYSAHAAMIVGLIGFAWTVSDHVVKRPTAAQIEAGTAAKPPQHAAEGPAAKRDEVAELRSANERMTRDVDALRAELGTLHAALGHDGTPDRLRALAGDLEGVKAGLNSVKGETSSAIAALSGKIDRTQRETDAKVQRLAAAGPLGQGMDMSATGSIAPGGTLAETRTAPAAPVQTRPSPPVQAHASPIPVPVARPASATRVASLEDARRDDAHKDEAPAKAAILPGWVVREVYQGVALIEGRRGALEVVPGVSIPGAGVVKSIDRHGNAWTVTTTKGLLAYAAPPRDYRRAARDYYPDPRGDF